ncbi:MAG: hypothetical protein JWN83_2015 [Chitinophagaceae bacterium]|nr:hypothetical protein [Chitinophagaceae bacterium]
MFKSKTERAIEDLKLQRNKAKVDGFDFDSWKIQTATYIGHYLGKDSEQYMSITKPSSRIYHLDRKEEEKKYFDSQEATFITNLINSSIEVIKVKGLYKHPKKRSISGISEGWLIFWAGILIGLMYAIFQIGYWYGEHSDRSSTSTLETNNKTEKTTYKADDSTHQKKMK